MSSVAAARLSGSYPRRKPSSTQLQIQDCAGGTAQTWAVPMGHGEITGYQNLCVDDRNASTADSNPIDIHGCNHTAAQQWTVESDGTLRVLGKCLDVRGGATANRTPVQLYTCNGTGAQQWRPQGDGSLINPQSTRCLDDPAFATTPGTQLEIHDCNSGANQKWALP